MRLWPSATRTGGRVAPATQRGKPVEAPWLRPSHEHWARALERRATRQFERRFTMERDHVITVLNDPLAQELLRYA
jgi:hypothetical protein